MIHLVYPHGERKSAPWSIGNHLLAFLESFGYEVRCYDWDQRIHMDDMVQGDILIGHPHEDPGFAFMSNLYLPWEKAIAIAPWNGTYKYHKRLERAAFRCDDVFCICGPYWRDGLPPGWRWLDLAIDCDDYPFIKHSFNPIGQRKILYIGHTLQEKGADYLAQISQAMPGVHIGHMGYGIIPGTHRWGYRDLSSAAAYDILREYDIVIAPGRNDANPATILEAMAWGLIPVCTQRSGWGPDDAIHIPLDDVACAATRLRRLLGEPEEYLRTIQDRNRKRAEEYYTWERFCDPILDAIRSRDYG